ncbi:MAG: hypothetical protein CMM95_00505 [Rickettsiales bacterium]|nr:hypothetical protein [Rickettsiales bacterium]
MNSCETLESTMDSTWDSISSAGDYIYDTVNFWEDEEPEQSEAIIIEEAVEVPEYALPDPNYQNQVFEQAPIQPQMSPPQPSPQQYYDPIYRSARQYYYVGPNGTPMLAPPPPPFPQYSIDQANPVIPYSYYNNYSNQPKVDPFPQQSQVIKPPQKNLPKMLTREEEMELFGIQNNCVRVVENYSTGQLACDDYD